MSIQNKYNWGWRKWTGHGGEDGEGDPAEAAAMESTLQGLPFIQSLLHKIEDEV